MERNTGPAITSVDRALSLLALLGSEESLAVTQAARMLGVAPSTAHRLLSTLAGRGFAVQDGRRRYSAGPALLAPGRARPAPSVVDRARPYLEQLFDTTAETCHLMVRDGTDVRFVDGIEGTQSLRVGLRTGMRMPAHTTSGGKAMLAEMAPDDDVSHPPAQRGSRLGVNRDESEPGVTAFGASLGVVADHHAALTIAVPSARLTSQRAQELSQQLIRICSAARAELAES